MTVPGASPLRIPSPGEVLAGKYRIRRVIGSGGMGIVLEAEHLRLRQPVAIKFLNPAMLDVPEVVERFEREARAAATLKSRHVVRVTDVEVTPEGVPYMVMELLEGTDLESERERCPKQPYADVVDYVLQACGGLAEAHDAGIVHRDLKPANLFLARESHDRVVVKVLDFGISKFLRDDTKLTSAGSVLGTALYMSPEQVRNGAVDERTDVWALGVILFELLSGSAPWDGPPTYVAASIVSSPLPDIRSACAIPDQLALAIESMLEKDASRRLASIVEVAAAVAPFAPPHSVGAAVAEQLLRRSARSLGSASPSVPMNPPASSRDIDAVASAKTMALDAPPGSARRPVDERSTIGATTAATTGSRPRSSHFWIGALSAFGLLGVIGAALIYFASTRAVRKVEIPAPATEAAPSPIEDHTGVGTSAPVASVIVVVSASVPMPSAIPAKPAAAPKPSAKRAPPPPASNTATAHPKPAETNPQFLK